ncbi:flagellar motor stator protein MotA [Thermodesulfobacterium commune]|uniref:Flagellar motor protein MotA n=1 Tax=Thermodesulfobacterium commune DSM 2178 TaxID=289377 RepID=A0A075WY76_9BACT|nr:flagellar motor stator protein MotA [Thermodesulfobacterium commune]AIH03542.1 flagellar motor protein MotA [Thermodesulfobacterium commune DSM 2178]
MPSIVGFIVVIICVFGGYALEHGNFSVLIQPVEWLIIFGAAGGALLAASTQPALKGAIQYSIKALTKPQIYGKQDFIDLLLLLNDIFRKIKKEGLISIEQDIENPEASKIFSSYPKVLANHHALDFIRNTFRSILTTNITHFELEALLENEIEIIHHENLEPVHRLEKLADSMPGLGLVAAVLGIILTMGKIDEPPEVLGHHLSIALAGTFIGILTCYGFLTPLVQKLEFFCNQEKEYLNVIKTAIVYFIGGGAPQIAVEFARRSISPHIRPSFEELENLMKGKK